MNFRSIAFCILALFMGSLARGQEVVFVLSSDIDKKEFKPTIIGKIYLKQQRFWDSGQKIRVIQREIGSKERNYFRKNFLKISEIDLLEYWIEKKQKLGLSKPMTMNSDAMVVHIVSTLKGSVGYVNAHSIHEKSVQQKIEAGLIRVGYIKMITND